MSPEAELAVCLPRSIFGWDVFCWIGHRRYSRHWSVPQIRGELQDSYQIRVSDDAIEDVIARYQAIVAAREQDFERLAEIYRDVERCVATKKRGAAEKALKRLAGCSDRGLDCVADELPEIRGHVEVVRSIAANLDPTQGDCEFRRARFGELHSTCQASTDPVRQQMAKVLLSFEQGLFSGGDVAGLPQDNLDPERWFRNPKGHERRIHGHRHAGVRIVLEGPLMIHALDADLSFANDCRHFEVMPLPSVATLKTPERRIGQRRSAAQAPTQGSRPKLRRSVSLAVALPSLRD